MIVPIQLSIVTALSRTNNVSDMLSSMESVIDVPNIDLNWIIVYDHGTKLPRDITSGSHNNIFKITLAEWKNGRSKYGINQKNFGLDKISCGFYHLLDDDNIVHPKFFRILSEACASNPSSKAFVFNQRRWDGYNDLFGSPSNMVPYHVDNTMCVVSMDIIGSKRYDIEKAGVEDGYFFSELYNVSKSQWTFVDKFAVYYNYLNHHKAEHALLDPDVDIFLITYRSEAYINKTIVDIKTKSVLRHRLKVIDNTGNPRTLTSIWNKCVEECISENICILNPDIELTDGWDKKLLDVLNARHDVAVAMPNRYSRSGGSAVKELGENLEGFYAFMAKRSFAKNNMNGFDERFRFYYADSEFQTRALSAFGKKTVQVDGCFVGHRGAVSTHEAEKRGEIDRYSELAHVQSVNGLLRSGKLKIWHQLSRSEKSDVRRNPAYSKMPVLEGKVSLHIDNIYSDDGRSKLVEAYVKSMWSAGIHHRTYWCGVPILQIPEDVMMISELIWVLKPSLVVECGIWNGGGLLFYASMMNLVGHGQVIGVDVDISRAVSHIKGHPLGGRVKLIQGDSTSPEVAKMIEPVANKGLSIFILDSNHSADHVRKELAAYAPMVKSGGYVIVMDGVMKILNDVPGGDRSWLINSPMDAITEFLSKNKDFYFDENCNKFGATHGPMGFLRKR